jgi:hypothetical protein
MNGIDNIAGYSLTVGTADFVITDSIAGYDPMIGNLSNGNFRSYKAQFIDPSMSDQYETGTGTWNASLSTFTRTTVKTSSNGGAKEVFGAGPKVIFIVDDYDSIQSMGSKFETTTRKIMTDVERDTIANLGDSSGLDVGTTAGTVAAGDDARFGSVDIGDLTPATSIDGTELLPADQGGDGVSITTQQVSGNPLTAERGLNRDRVRFWCAFRNTSPTFSSSTTGAQFGAEPYEVYASGASAGVAQAMTFLVPAAWPTTGTTNTGYAGFRCNLRPFAYDKTKEMTEMFQLTLLALPSVENYRFQAGFTDGTPSAFNNGMYFRLSNSSANFQAVVNNAGGETVVTTTVAAAAFAPYVMKWVNDPTDASVKFYINGALVATVLNSTREVAANTVLAPVQEIAKLAGTTAASYVVSNHYIDVETTALAHY